MDPASVDFLRLFLFTPVFVDQCINLLGVTYKLSLRKNPLLYEILPNSAQVEQIVHYGHALKLPGVGTSQSPC